MDRTAEKQPTVISPKTAPESDPTKIDRNAPAGTPSSLGAESVRDGRPSTDDSVVEAMDEEAPPFLVTSFPAGAGNRACSVYSAPLIGPWLSRKLLICF
jgi:hypothetical protein